MTPQTNPKNIFLTRAGGLIFPLIAPLLFGFYPAYYFYTKNASMVKIASLGRVIGVYAALIVVLYLVALLVHKFNGIRAANAVCAVLLFFNTYGIVYTELQKADLFRVEHLTLLPFFIFLALYSAWFLRGVKKKTARSLWRGITLVFLALAILTSIKLIPMEVKKARTARASAQAVNVAVSASNKDYPDIYYLMFDEFSGFEAMRQYFHTPEVEDFDAFLKESGFWVAENSFGSSNHTVHQVAVRLNYTEYPYVQGNQPIWHQALATNQAIALLESKGYSTMVFEEISMLHPTLPDIKADYLYHFGYSTSGDMGILFDEYGMMVADSTMLYAFDDMYRVSNPADKAHYNFLMSMQERLPNLQDVPQPRFVYAHFMLPHQPFMFDKNGGLVDSSFYRNWNYYEGNYIYAMKYIRKLVTSILANADTQNPPIIILQSDHGARIRENNLELKGFPQDMLRNILFAMYLPGYDTSALPQDENPINTLPLVFNHYLGENLPLLPPNLHGVEEGD